MTPSHLLYLPLEDPSGTGVAIDHPWLVYTALAMAILVAVASTVPKITGPLGKTIDEWTERQRSAATRTDDADITELKRSLRNMGSMLAEERRQNSNHRALIAELYRYILAAQMDPANLQNRVPDPFAHLDVQSATLFDGFEE